MILRTFGSTGSLGLGPITSTAGNDRAVASRGTTAAYTYPQLIRAVTVASMIQRSQSIWIERPSQFDRWITVEGNLSDAVSLSQPIAVHLWREGDELVADVPAYNLHAFGDSVGDALRSLAEAIIEQLEWLNSLGEHVSPAFAVERDTLRNTLRLNDAKL